MATTAHLLPSIKLQMALQTLPQFIFQGALRDHHLENNKSAKIRGEQRALKITAKCSLLTKGSKHIVRWDASTYPRWTSAASTGGGVLSILLILNFHVHRHASPFSSHHPIPSNPHKHTQVWIRFTATVKVRDDRQIHLLFMSLHPRHLHCWSGLNKRQVSTSCLLKLMFSWLEMNCPVMRIYLYSS